MGVNPRNRPMRPPDTETLQALQSMTSASNTHVSAHSAAAKQVAAIASVYRRRHVVMLVTDLLTRYLVAPPHSGHGTPTANPRVS
jgi:hypothetical protein